MTNKNEERIVFPSGKIIAHDCRYVSIVSTLLRVSLFQRKTNFQDEFTNLNAEKKKKAFSVNANKLTKCSKRKNLTNATDFRCSSKDIKNTTT